jgi:hypothetical protein
MKTARILSKSLTLIVLNVISWGCIASGMG